jgi:protein TonB
MLDSYAIRRDISFKRLSAGFGGAFFLYGGLIASVLLLHNGEKLIEAASEPTRLIMMIPPAMPPAAPAPALAKAAAKSSATPVTKTETPKVIKPELAPKVLPNEVATQNNNTATNNTAAPIDVSGLDGDPNADPLNSGTCVGPNCSKDPKTAGTCTGDNCGTDPNAQGAPDEGGPVPLKSGMEPPKKIADQCAPPRYPETARSAGLSGTVKLRISVSREGKVSQMSVLDGPEIFVDAAKEYLENCSFTPAEFNGRAIAVTKLEVVNFTLR